MIEYKDYVLKCFDVSVGKTRNISIYNEEGQIAEIVKPLSTTNNLDYYYLFLLDKYKDELCYNKKRNLFRGKEIILLFRNET